MDRSISRDDEFMSVSHKKKKTYGSFTLNNLDNPGAFVFFDRALISLSGKRNRRNRGSTVSNNMKLGCLLVDTLELLAFLIQSFQVDGNLDA